MTAETKEPTPSLTELRATLLEHDRDAPLTPEQQAKLPTKLNELKSSIDALRACPLADGGSEPITLFHPHPPVPSQPAGTSGDVPDNTPPLQLPPPDPRRLLAQEKPHA